MNDYVVSVMVKTAKDNIYQMSEDMPYDKAKELFDEIDEAMLNKDPVIRLSSHALVATDSILTVRIMPSVAVKGGER